MGKGSPAGKGKNKGKTSPSNSAKSSATASLAEAEVRGSRPCEGRMAGRSARIGRRRSRSQTLGCKWGRLSSKCSLEEVLKQKLMENARTKKHGGGAQGFSSWICVAGDPPEPKEPELVPPLHIQHLAG